MTPCRVAGAGGRFAARVELVRAVVAGMSRAELEAWLLQEGAEFERGDRDAELRAFVAFKMFLHTTEHGLDTPGAEAAAAAMIAPWGGG